MDYEKKYNDALERARKIHDEIVNNEVIGFPGQITDIFPELRESEDERMRNQLIYDVEYHKKEALISAKQNKATKALYNGIEKCYDEKIAWLKSLRPQPKAELTLLDENIIEAAVAFVEQNDHFNVWRGIDKHTVLKALRSLKPHWKPSEEQMEALKRASTNEYISAKQFDILVSLYEQLKKLGVKEEPEYYQHFDPDC